jgi:hypothetical protein
MKRVMEERVVVKERSPTLDSWQNTAETNYTVWKHKHTNSQTTTRTSTDSATSAVTLQHHCTTHATPRWEVYSLRFKFGCASTFIQDGLMLATGR